MATTSRIGVRLRQARNQADITQHQLALRIGCQDQEISRYERGAIEPRTERVQQLATALGVSPGWLLFGEFTAVPAEPEAAA